MINIAIDIGSYSIKFLTFKVDKKSVSLISSKEVILDTDEYNTSEEQIVLGLQLKIISNFLSEIKDEYKLILNTPTDLISTRFIEIPIKDKKKALQMLPYQLEEEIPYSLSESHISSSINIAGESCQALVNICKHTDFAAFHKKLIDYNVTPNLLTSEISVIDQYIRTHKDSLPQAFCVLDLGHSTTHAYYFLNNELVANHTSYIAGKTINEVISENYNISSEEASIYKHQNCYFLTNDQMDTVNENQKSFAEMMNKVYKPFFNEFKRWDIGFRVKNGMAINEVLIIGGTSNIKNIKNYFTQELGLKVNFLNAYSDVNTTKIDSDDVHRRKFAIANLLAAAAPKKSKFISFLTQNYSIKGQIDIPLHSFAFIATRVATVMMIILMSLFVERIFISKDLDASNKKLKALAKNPILKLSPKHRRLIAKKPKSVEAGLKRKIKTIRQEVKTLQSSVETNAFKSLEVISHLVSGLNIEIIQFQSVSGGDFVAILKTKSIEDLNQIDDQFNASNIKNLFTDKSLKKRIITINGSED